MSSDPRKTVTTRSARPGPILAVALSAALAAPLQAGGDGRPILVWSQESGTEGWLPNAVSIGNRGTQVFTQVGPVHDYTRLLSAHDAGPPTPVWTHTDTRWTYEHRVDSADLEPVHVAIHKSFVSGITGPKRATVQRYTSDSPTPTWEYTFAIDHYGTESIDVAVSRDGQVIVAAVFDSSIPDTRIAVFRPDGTLESSTLTGTLSAHSKMLLSADGSTLYLWAGPRLIVYDVPSAQIVWITVVFNGPIRWGHALSADGGTFAYGGGNEIRIYRRNAQGGYSSVHTHVLPSSLRADALAISDDGSMLVCGANHLDALTIRALAIDLTSFQVTMSYETVGAGTLSNIVSDIGVAPGGDRFAVGLWGDEVGLVPEVLFFDTRVNQPVGWHEFPGSTLSLDFAADGQHVVVASKGVHANTFGGGGRFSLFRMCSADFRLRGIPRAGQEVEFDLFAMGSNPSNGFLVMSPLLAAEPEVIPGVGTLFLERQNLTLYPMGPIGPDGVATSTWLVDPSLAPGASLYFQGLASGPRHLSTDWVKLTVLP